MHGGAHVVHGGHDARRTLALYQVTHDGVVEVVNLLPLDALLDILLLDTESWLIMIGPLLDVESLAVLVGSYHVGTRS